MSLHRFTPSTAAIRRPGREIEREVVVDNWRYIVKAYAPEDTDLAIFIEHTRHRRGFLRRMFGLPARVTPRIEPRFYYSDDAKRRHMPVSRHEAHIDSIKRRRVK